MNREFHGIDRYLTDSLFWEKVEHLPRGPYVTSYTLLSSPQTMQACQSCCLRRQKSWQKTNKTCHLPKNTEQMSLRMTSALQVICCFAHNVELKRADTCRNQLQPKTLVKNKS